MAELKWFAIMLIVGLPVMIVWYFILGLFVRPFGIRVGVYWPTRNGRERMVAERAALTRPQYVIVYGVLGWGFGVALLLSATNYIAYRLGIQNADTLKDVTGRFIAFALGGIGFGWFIWAHR